MKLYQLQKLQKRRHFVANRFIVGVDPAKARHQAQILDPEGLPLGSSFSFPTTYTGFNERLWHGLQARLPAPLSELPRHKLTEHLVFAVEASCNLWPTLVHFLEAQHGRTVLVSPLATCPHRPAKSGNFSRTDCKDAFLIADLARHRRPGSAGHLPLPRKLHARAAGPAPARHHLRQTPQESAAPLRPPPSTDRDRYRPG